MKDLRELLAHEIRDLYSAESQIIQALPRMAKAVKDQKLRKTFDKQLSETEAQQKRLKQIAGMMAIPLQGSKCRGMEGLINEEERLLGDISEPHVLDAAMIGAAQRIEHYKIAGYGTAKAYAEQIGENQIADLLSRSLSEDKHADQSLTDVAVHQVNQTAMA